MSPALLLACHFSRSAAVLEPARPAPEHTPWPVALELPTGDSIERQVVVDSVASAPLLGNGGCLSNGDTAPRLHVEVGCYLVLTSTAQREASAANPSCVFAVHVVTAYRAELFASADPLPAQSSPAELSLRRALLHHWTSQIRDIETWQAMEEQAQPIALPCTRPDPSAVSACQAHAQTALRAIRDAETGFWAAQLPGSCSLPNHLGLGELNRGAQTVP